MSRTNVISLALLLCLCGCSGKETSTRVLTPFIKAVLESSVPGFSDIRDGFIYGSPKGDVYILDSPERSVALGEYLSSFDGFDNVDASAISDSLPDFAGEKLISVLDFSLSAKDSFAFRDKVVADVLCSMNPGLRKNESDSTTLKKNTPKLLIASSAAMTLASSADIDTLFGNLVIFPVTAMFEDFSRKQIRNIGVITPYGESFAAICRDRSIGVFTESLSSLYITDPFKSFLSQYLRSGNAEPLQRIVIDDFSIKEKQIRDSYLNIILSSDSEDKKLRSLLSDDFDFVRTAEIAAREAFVFLRKDNLFTHEISYPENQAYLCGADNIPLTLIQFSMDAVPSEFESQFMASAPKFYSTYVQNLNSTIGY